MAHRKHESVFALTDQSDVPDAVPGVSLMDDAHVSISALLNFKWWIKNRKQEAAFHGCKKHLQICGWWPQVS